MCPYHDPEERVSILQMNSELQHAQLELLSAHCATHQLRLHYSASDLARFGRRDVLRKSAQAASALNAFYATIEKQIPEPGATAGPALHPTEELIMQAAGWITSFLREQREHYLPAAAPLGPELKAILSPYFSAALLNRAQILELKGARVAPPDFFTRARALGFDTLPEISHMDSLTFLDVLVFNEQVTERALFHALVHTVQIEVLGLERYAELWVRSFIKTRAHFTVPLEVHAFSLSSKFLLPQPERFSVEEQVRLWFADKRY
jgi:hypothetical protein